MKKYKLITLTEDELREIIRSAYIHGQGNAEMMESGLERNEVDEYISWEIAKIKKGAYSLQAPPHLHHQELLKKDHYQIVPYVIAQ